MSFLASVSNEKERIGQIMTNEAKLPIFLTLILRLKEFLPGGCIWAMRLGAGHPNGAPQTGSRATRSHGNPARGSERASGERIKWPSRAMRWQRRRGTRGARRGTLHQVAAAGQCPCGAYAINSAGRLGGRSPHGAARAAQARIRRGGPVASSQGQARGAACGARPHEVAAASQPTRRTRGGAAACQARARRTRFPLPPVALLSGARRTRQPARAWPEARRSALCAVQHAIRPAPVPWGRSGGSSCYLREQEGKKSELLWFLRTEISYLCELPWVYDHPIGTDDPDRFTLGFVGRWAKWAVCAVWAARKEFYGLVFMSL